MFWRRKIAKRYNIAVCLYGHMRTFDFCAPFLYKNLLKYYNYDMFIHTWSKIDHNTKTWHNFSPRFGETEQQQIHKAYGDIKKLIIEEQIVEELGYTRFTYAAEARALNIAPRGIDRDVTWFSEVPVKDGFSIFAIKSMFHSMASTILAAQEYRQNNNLTYDYILVTRPDIWLKSPFLIDRIIASVSGVDVEKNILCASMSRKLATIHSALDILILAKPDILIECMENKGYVINQLLTKKIPFYNPETVFIELLRQRGDSYQIMPLSHKKDFVIQRFE